MSKRGQATIIIFFAIIILVIIGLIFFLRGQFYFGGESQSNLARELEPITKHIEKCLYTSTQKTAILLGKQGGYLDPQENTYRLHNDQKISYLCYNKPKLSSCSNRYLTITSVKEQMAQAITQELNTCLKVEALKKSGFELTLGNRVVQVDIGSDNIITTLNYPIKLRKGTAEAQIEVFKKAVPLPLGRLLDVTRDIVNAKSFFGFFDTLTYTLVKTKFSYKPYIIEKLQPYPDELYILKIKNIPTQKEEYIFQFFIEGEE